MKKVFLITMLFSALFMLTACTCRHEWNEATCIQPSTCSRCGAAEGDALGHTWVAADCENPKTCSVCGAAEGDALGHTWVAADCVNPKTCSVCGTAEGDALGHDIDEWSVVSESSCTENGIESGYCTVCGKLVERELELKEHTAGDWIVVTPASANANGVRIKECTVCGKELENERFSLTPEEIKQLYISSCQSISYDNLSRSPQEYEGTPVKMSGKVVQICSEASSPLYYSTYRVATSGSYGNVVLIYVDNYGSGTRILEDDWIHFYGDYDGLYSYKTVLGASLTIPSVKVKYLD